MNAIWFFIGFIAGMLFMAWACKKDREEITARHEADMRQLRQELEDAESRIEELHNELYAKGELNNDDDR